MVHLTPTHGPGDITFQNQTAELTCTNAVAKGDAVLLNLASGGYTSCTKSVSANTTPPLLIGVALETVAAGAIGSIGLKGVFDCNCAANMDAGASGGVGTVTGQLAAISTNPTADGSAYLKMVAVPLENTATAGDLTSCLFDGINGFAAQNN